MVHTHWYVVAVQRAFQAATVFPYVFIEQISLYLAVELGSEGSLKTLQDTEEGVKDLDAIGAVGVRPVEGVTSCINPYLTAVRKLYGL